MVSITLAIDSTNSAKKDIVCRQYPMGMILKIAMTSLCILCYKPTLISWIVLALVHKGCRMSKGLCEILY